MKVIKKVTHNQASTFLNLKNLLHTYQYGLRKRYSMDFCLPYLNDKILKGFYRHRIRMTSMILIDLQKAFDKIDHYVLFQKLYAIGFSNHTVNWCKSCLSSRSYLVNSGNNFSQPASVFWGVPQASVLWPLLFLIYFNDTSLEITPLHKHTHTHTHTHTHKHKHTQIRVKSRFLLHMWLVWG